MLATKPKSFKSVKAALDALCLDQGFNPFLHGGMYDRRGRLWKRANVEALTALGYPVETEGTLRILLFVDQRGAVARGLPAPNSSEVVYTDPSKIPLDLRQAFADAWDPRTGRITVNGVNLTVVDVRAPWHDAFRSLIERESKS